MNRVSSVGQKELAAIKTVQYLCGDDVAGLGRLYSSKSSNRNRKAVLASPFSRYLKRVNQFLFSGGLSLDVMGADAPDPRQDWIEMQTSHMKLDSLLDDIWTQGAITGEIFLAFTQAKNLDGTAQSVFDVRLFDKPEFVPVYSKSGELVSVTVTQLRMVDGEKMVWRSEYDSEKYSVWPLMKLSSYQMGQMPEPEETPHSYGAVPGVVIQNLGQDFRERGRSSFDAAATDMAIELVNQLCDSASAYHHFGQPIILSPDARETLKRLRQRANVLEKLPEADGGAPSVLQMQPMPSDHKEFVRDLSHRLAAHLGTPEVEETGRTGREISSLTLKIMHAETIACAEKFWCAYVTDGLKALFEKMLVASAFEGVLANVNPNDPDSFSVAITRKRPYFSVSPAEKQQQLQIVEQLVLLGVRREDALAQEFYTEKSAEQVLEMLEGDII